MRNEYPHGQEIKISPVAPRRSAIRKLRLIRFGIRVLPSEVDQDDGPRSESQPAVDRQERWGQPQVFLHMNRQVFQEVGGHDGRGAGEQREGQKNSRGGRRDAENPKGTGHANSMRRGPCGGSSVGLPSQWHALSSQHHASTLKSTSFLQGSTSPHCAMMSLPRGSDSWLG